MHCVPQLLGSFPPASTQHHSSFRQLLGGGCLQLLQLLPLPCHSQKQRGQAASAKLLRNAALFWPLQQRLLLGNSAALTAS